LEAFLSFLSFSLRQQQVKNNNINFPLLFLANETCSLNELGCLSNLINGTFCEDNTDGKAGCLG
jgi:hypothetical protein